MNLTVHHYVLNSKFTFIVPVCVAAPSVEPAMLDYFQNVPVIINIVPRAYSAFNIGVDPGNEVGSSLNFFSLPLVMISFCQKIDSKTKNYLFF